MSRYAIMDKTSGELLRDYVPAPTTRRTYKRKTRDIRNDIIGGACRLLDGDDAGGLCAGGSN